MYCIEFVLNGIFSSVILIILEIMLDCHNEKNLSFLKMVSSIKKILQRCVKIEAPKSHHLDKTGNTSRFFFFYQSLSDFDENHLLQTRDN